MPTNGKSSDTAAATASGTGEEPSLLAQLKTQVETEQTFDAQPWVPQNAGEGIEGEVIGIFEYHDENYDNDRLLRSWVVREKNGDEWSVIPFHSRLRKEMRKHRAEVGDKVGILYLGEQTSPSDAEIYFKDYRVARVAAARQARMRRNGDADRIMTADTFSEKLDVAAKV